MTLVKCELCGSEEHSIQIHLTKAHPETTFAEYRSTFPHSPVLSDEARRRVLLRRQQDEAAKTTEESSNDKHLPLHEIFDLRSSKQTKNGRGDDIMITYFADVDVWGDNKDYIPDIDHRYNYNLDLLKTVLMGFEINKPVYLWGHAGVGKSTLPEQICARTNRPLYRVQHTDNMEEAHVVGQTLANEQGTYFEPGPLALALKYGFVYLADEYDFAHPSIVAVYQAVLEGKSLVIKEAPSEWRIVKPHPQFRFIATGNTNGSGDDTFLYAGTKIGNAANYSRFAITCKVDYMSRDLEVATIISQGRIDKTHAEQLRDFAELIREAFDGQKIGATIGPRELINSAIVGALRLNFREGLRLAFVNRLSSVDAEIAEGFLTRVVEDKITL